MNNLKKIILEFRLSMIRNNLKENAEEMYELINNGLDYLRNYNEQLRLMSCKSYLENKLSVIN